MATPSQQPPQHTYPHNCPSAPLMLPTPSPLLLGHFHTVAYRDMLLLPSRRRSDQPASRWATMEPFGYSLTTTTAYLNTSITAPVHQYLLPLGHLFRVAYRDTHTITHTLTNTKTHTYTQANTHTRTHSHRHSFILWFLITNYHQLCDCCDGVRRSTDPGDPLLRAPVFERLCMRLCLYTCVVENY